MRGVNVRRIKRYHQGNQEQVVIETLLVPTAVTLWSKSFSLAATVKTLKQKHVR